MKDDKSYLRHRRFITVLVSAFLMVGFYSGSASAHWDMDSRFWYDKKAESKSKFGFRIHNGTHANREPIKRILDVCFWIEAGSGVTYAPASEQKCEIITLKPDTWKSFSFDVYDLKIYKSAKAADKLKNGSYKAKVSARERKNKLMSIIFGAALERLFVDFVVKKGEVMIEPKGTWK